MFKMLDGIDDCCLTLFLQESRIEGRLSHASLGSKSTHLIVSEVTRMVTQSTTATMTAYDRHTAYLQCIIEALLCSMAHIHHDSQTIHLTNHLFTKTAHTSMSVTSSCRITDIIVTIMAESDIYHTTLNKVLKVLQLSVEGYTVLDTKHYRLTSITLILIQISRSTGDADILTICFCYLLNLVEDKISIFQRSWHIEIDKRRECLTNLWLRQISHHYRCILATLVHLMQIHKYLRVAMVEMYPLWEEHRGIAMSIECQYPIM